MDHAPSLFCFVHALILTSAYQLGTGYHGCLFGLIALGDMTFCTQGIWDLWAVAMGRRVEADNAVCARFHRCPV